MLRTPARLVSSRNPVANFGGSAGRLPADIAPGAVRIRFVEQLRKISSRSLAILSKAASVFL